MSQTLVIVESPAKAKTIKRYLGKNYSVTASMGHVRDLPKSQFGVDVDNDFAVTLPPQRLHDDEKAVHRDLRLPDERGRQRP